MIARLGDLAARCAGRVVGDPQTTIDSIAAVGEVGPGSLTFATDATYYKAALRSKAAAILTDERTIDGEVEFPKPLLVVESARVGLADLLLSFEAARPSGPQKDPSASVAGSATIGERVYIGAQAVIGPEAVVGDDCVIEAGAQVGASARLGAGSRLHPRALLLDRCIAGERVVLQPGAVVGSDGFGYVLVDGAFKKIPQIGNVVIEDDVEIGANTCIDRAQIGSTVIGAGTKIDNLVQVGHNCRIGKHCGFAALTGISGSTVFGDYVQVGGMTGFAGHMVIGDRAKIAGGSEIWGDVAADAFVSGRPARDHRAELRLQALIHALPKLFDRVNALEKKGTKAPPEGR